MANLIAKGRRFLVERLVGDEEVARDDAWRGHALRILAVFFVVSLFFWAFRSGVYRHAAPLELVACLGLALLVMQLRWQLARLLVFVLVLLLVNADTKRPNWGRTRVASSGLGIQMPALAPDSMVLAATGEAVAYLALGLPDSVPLVSVNNNLLSPAQCAALDRLAAQRIAGHAGAFYAIALPGRDAAASLQKLSDAFGLGRAGRCIDIPNGLAPAVLCPLRRVRSVPACTAAPTVTPPDPA